MLFRNDLAFLIKLIGNKAFDFNRSKKMHFDSIKPKCLISLEEYFKFEFIDIFVEFEINFFG